MGSLTAHDKQGTHEQLSQKKQKKTVIYLFTYFLSYFDFVMFNQNVPYLELQIKMMDF